MLFRSRKVHNQIESMTVIGDVKGKDVVIIDDLIDTAGTLTKSAQMMMEHGAKTVRALITHPVLSGPAYERIEDSVLTELVVTDTIPLKQESSKIKVLGVADLFASTMRSIVSDESISSQFII